MCEYPQAYVCDQAVARKEHVCCECHGRIDKREKYFNHHGVWDGIADTFKVCADCESLRKQIDAETPHYEDRVAFGNLHEHVFEKSQHKPWMQQFIDIKTRRSARVEDWMRQRLEGEEI